MQNYIAPVEDVRFLLDHVLVLAHRSELAGRNDDASPDMVADVLAAAATFCEEVLAPLNASGDRDGCVRHPDGRVTTPAGFKQAYRRYVEGGWLGVSVPTEHGGLGLPVALNQTINEFMCSANLSFAMYPTLTQGAIAALIAHGTPVQQALYLPRLVTGEWTGTMNLTEAQCGTDLGLIRTRATPQPDGSHRVTGTKTFISAGEHDLADNIVHLVLARLDGAPAGTRGLSLFVVPKILPMPDGAPGVPNAVTCGGIEDKMGIHANATCMMDYAGATGWLVGRENEGLPAMFTMMNEARLGVGVQGLGLSEVAYQHAVAYAKERLQGRALSGTVLKDRPADPLIVHADIRRLLMTMRAVNEAGRALILSTAIETDIARHAADDARRRAADDRVGLLTPVIKGVLTELGFANAVRAQQVFGGHGYIRGSGVEQFVRDARIPMIYEGTNGIQALDLVGRKLGKDGGRAVMAFFAEVQGFCDAQADAAMAPYAGPLVAALGDLQQATLWFMRNAVDKPDNAGAGATDYMHLFGLVALGFMWARMAAAAHTCLARQEAPERMRAKLATGRVFMERMLPETALRLARIRAGAASTMELPAEAF